MIEDDILYRKLQTIRPLQRLLGSLAKSQIVSGYFFTRFGASPRLTDFQTRCAVLAFPGELADFVKRLSLSEYKPQVMVAIPKVGVPHPQNSIPRKSLKTEVSGDLKTEPLPGGGTRVCEHDLAR